jgi:intracellular septation protein A
LNHRAVMKSTGFFILLVVIAGSLSVWLGQDANWDLQNYHIYNAFALIHGRHAMDVGATPQWYFNPLLDLPYYALIHFFLYHPKVVAFVQGGQAAILWAFLWLVFEQGRSYLSINAWLTRCAWGVACCGSALISEVGTTFNDIPQASLAILGLYFVNRHLATPSNWRPLALGFLLFGVSVGLKLTSAVFMVAATVALFASVRSIRDVGIAVLAGTAGVVLSGGWWFAHLVAQYQNPFFPYFNNFFHSPWWPPISMTDGNFLPRNALQWIAYPAYWLEPNRGLVTEVEFADGRLLMGLVGAVVTLLWCTRNRRQDQTGADPARATRYICFISLFYLISYLLWLRTFSIYRYAMPLESLAPLMWVMGGVAIQSLPGSKAAKPFVPVLICAVLFGTAWITRYPNWVRAPYSDVALGVRTTLDARGATIIAAAGDPPVTHMFALFPKAAHFLTVSGGDMLHTRLFEQATSVVASSNKVYVVFKEDKNPQFIQDIQRYWELVPSSTPCIPVWTNIGGSFMACELLHKAH